MSTSLLTTGVAGALFGAALAASGVYLPSVIVSQMELTNFHMLKVFLGASASSALVIFAFERLGLSKCEPRQSSSLGWFSRFDGNIVGGLLIGAGMTLTGACPGTSLVQVAAGIRSGWLVVVGGILGGIAYVSSSKFMRRAQGASTDASPTHTIHEKLDISQQTGLLAYEIACLAVIATALVLESPSPSLLNPVLGALFIGAAQASSLLLTGKPVGVSTGYEEIGQAFWRGVEWLGGKPTNPKNKPLQFRSMIFAAGILIGSRALIESSPSAAATELQLSSVKAVLGGFSMVYGARIAGGCTSGHGISGMSVLSTSSVVSVMSMFAGGIGLAQLMR